MSILRPIFTTLLAAAIAVCAPLHAEPEHGGIAAVSSASLTGTGEGDVRIGVMDTISTAVDAASLTEGLVLLSKPLEKDFRIYWRDIVTPDAAPEVLHQKPDFLILPTEQSDLIEEQGVQMFRIATRKPWTATDAAHAVGSLVVTRADRADINSLEDLKGKHVVADTPTSLTGWLAVQGEIARAGHDPDKFFGRTSFLSFAYPGVLSAVLQGRADAAVLPTCLLELLDSRGLIDASDLKGVGVRDSDAVVCRHSTALYPDISIVAFPWTPEPLVKRMTLSLLSAGSDVNYEWSTMVGTSDLRELYRLLEIGPYRHLRDMSPMAVYKRWKTEIHLGLLILLLLILNEFRLRGLVAKRTSELSDALSALKASQAEAAVVRDQLGALERKNIVAQMSGMIAHEIKSPVGAIRNFAAVVKILLKDAIAKNPNAKTAVESIDAEALKIAGIVDRVRGYVKNRTANHAPTDLKHAVDRGVRAFKLGQLASVPVLVQMPETPAVVLGDGLELELLVLNLVKNAAEAVHELRDERGRPTGRVIVTLSKIDRDASHGAQWMLAVADNGRKLTEDEKARLMHSLESVKPDGLGLGLSIVRGIADSHGAAIEFEAKHSGGVVVSVLFDELDEEAASRAAAEAQKNQ